MRNVACATSASPGAATPDAYAGAESPEMGQVAADNSQPLSLRVDRPGRQSKLLGRQARPTQTAGKNADQKTRLDSSNAVTTVLGEKLMSWTSSTRLCQIVRATAAWAIVGSLACLNGRAGETENETLKRPALPDSDVRKSSPDSARYPKLRQELLSRMAEDQEARMKWLRLIDHPQQPKDAEEQVKLATYALRDVDRKNLARMKEIVNRSGWPGKTLVGSDGSDAAWLLVQHADSDLAFQKRCLALIVAAVKKGESPREAHGLSDGSSARRRGKEATLRHAIPRCGRHAGAIPSRE